MQDNNNTNLPPDDYRSQYQNYNYVRDNLELRVGFGRRLGAYIIDMMIILTSLIIFSLLTGFLQESFDYFKNFQSIAATNNPEYLKALIEQFGEKHYLTFLFFSLSMLFYNSLEAIIAASPGKLLLDMRIASENRTRAESKILWQRFLIKNSPAILSFVNSIIVISFLDTFATLAGIAIFIGYFFILGAKRQGFHDMLAKTAVYRKYDIIIESN